MAVSKKSIKSDLAMLDRMKDRDIDYEDIPPLGKEKEPVGDAASYPKQG